MTALRYHRFDTPLGRCGIAWTDAGVARLQLPEADDRLAVSSLERRGAVDAEPPPEIAAVCRDAARHLGGQPADFSAVTLDLSGVAEFARRVYAAARRIPAGRTATYGEIAAEIGAPGEARAVGQALGANPIPLIVPCHRVVGSGRRLGGFSAPGGTVTKTRLLALEGVGLPLDWAASGASR
jgi:O-6-methylguanine DNA methyltransferase